MRSILRQAMAGENRPVGQGQHNSRHGMDPRRLRRHHQDHPNVGPVLYWMHRDFRARDNWALIHAREEALRRRTPLAAVFTLAPRFLDATLRAYDFLLRGLVETAATLRRDNIALIVRVGDPATEMRRLCTTLGPALVVTDFDPLRVKREWLRGLVDWGGVAVHEVDSRNIVPCWLASDHREFMARTLRPKLHRILTDFLVPFPHLEPHPFSWPEPWPEPDFAALRAQLRVDAAVAPVSWLEPGETAARRMLDNFLTQRLARYNQRNDPNVQVCSDLSPYLHFGMIASQRVALAVQASGLGGEQAEAFLEELIVRRELADNFCLHCQNYDRVEGFPAWSRQTLDRHRSDRRPYLYEQAAFETASTHDPLWNAAQRQMVATGKMHGYLRMYWAKKILEWTESPEQAMAIAVRLNDRYSLDGRDSNGYAGIAWAIGGVHDRGWAERPVFGSIRFMNDRGAARKFDVKRYIQTWTGGQMELFLEAGRSQPRGAPP